MRAIKTMTISMLSVSLLAGSAVGVTAQDEEAAAATDPMAPTRVSGQAGGDMDLAQEPTETVKDGMLEVRGLTLEGDTVEFDDARLSGTATVTLNEDVYRVSDFEDIVLQSGQLRIDNDAGTWLGHGTAVVHAGAGMEDDEMINFDTYILTGSGAYDGLTAYTIWDFTEDPITIEGVIIAGEMPPSPDLPTEEADTAE